jgi:uncharacterized protein
MKKVILFHSTGGTPNHFWFPFIKRQLPKDKYKVRAPQLPNKDNPDINEWFPFALDKYSFDENTILVDHSAGCPLILSILENIDSKIEKAILVSGFSKPLDEDPEPILQNSYNWKKIKSNCKSFVFINSVNEPWGCNDEQGRNMLDKLGGDLIIRSDQGHMGSESFNQPYKEFPLIVSLIENKLR